MEKQIIIQIASESVPETRLILQTVEIKDSGEMETKNHIVYLTELTEEQQSCVENLINNLFDK